VKIFKVRIYTKSHMLHHIVSCRNFVISIQILLLKTSAKSEYQPQSSQYVSRSRFEISTFLIYARIFIALASLLDLKLFYCRNSCELFIYWSSDLLSKYLHFVSRENIHCHYSIQCNCLRSFYSIFKASVSLPRH
jgi:hypothetical protein